MAGITEAATRTRAAATPQRTATQALPLGALVNDSYNGYRWAPPSANNTWNVLQQLHDNGVEWCRAWSTIQSFPELRANPNWWQYGWKNEYWACQEVAAGILSAAAQLGMRLQAVLFLSDQPGDAGKYLLPAAWKGMTQAQVNEQIRLTSAATASYFKSLGLNIEVFELGNEIDFGILGMGLGKTVNPPLGTDWTTDVGWMRDNVWGPMAPMLQAAIDGVRTSYPNAKMLLHIAGFGYSPGNVLTPGFFKSMIDLGVNYDIAGLSYPYMTNSGPVVPQPYFAQADFQNTLTALAALGKSIQLVEFNYPASTIGTAQTPSSLYPYTEQGQADFIRDFADSLRGKVERLFYWYPDYYPGFRNDANPELGSCGLFSAKDRPRSALAVMKDLSRAGISATDCLFDWAELNYDQYFPRGGGNAGTYSTYTYRYYAAKKNYLAISSADNYVYVMGPSFGSGIVQVGPAASFLAAASCPSI